MSKRSIVSMQCHPDKNKRSRGFFGKRFQAAVVLILICCTGGGPFSWAQVSLATGQSRYKRTEAVSLVLANGIKEDIFSAAAGNDPDSAVINFEKRKNQWVWDAFPVRCPRLECPGQQQAEDADLRPVAQGQQAGFLWKPRMYKDKSLRAPEPGAYRVTVLYQKRVPSDPLRKVWATVKSNEFILE
jgi:hypothetical protein